jgi:hypothetical protein
VTVAYPENFVYTKPLQLDSAGRAVRVLQARLGLEQTGRYTASVEDTVLAYQKCAGVVADGIYGPQTNAVLTGRTFAAMVEIVGQLGVDLHALQAVLKVETAGKGFLDNGLPKILLERHKVWRMSTDKQRAQLDDRNCNEQPGGYVGGLAEWGRYTQVAAVIGEAAAAACCSWGLPQIMGANYDACDAASVDEFVRAMCQNEDSQLRLMAAFLHNNSRMLTALQKQDWVDFALAYNGPNQGEMGYATKLEAAYAAATAAPTTSASDLSA